ncbi:MAG: amidohydrolase [Haliangiales bacterium]
MLIAALQTDIAWEAPEQNFERLRPRVRAAASAGAKLIVLPEMFACGFSMNAAAIQEPEDGPSARFLGEMAAEHQVWITGSLPELGEGAARPRNTMLVAGPDGERHRYHKLHPFTFAREHEHYDAGRERVTVTVEGVRLSLFICYDLRFADEFWAQAEDTDAYLVVANWPARRRQHWRTLLRARAIENQAYVVGVNRVGVGDDIPYAGDSAIIDPWGETLVEATKDPTMLLADIDPGRVREARTKFPFLRDRR